MKDLPEGTAAADLRYRAEEELRRRRSEYVPLDADVHKLLHELQVHQIELEMQNDELRKAQLQLTLHRDELEGQVAERTENLRSANQDLQGFIYAASHDMAGPLGRINSFSTLLKNNHGDHLDDNGRFFLEIIQQNATRLLALLRDLLQHAHIGQQAPSVQSIDLNALVDSVVGEFDVEIRDSGTEVRIQLPVTKILANPERLAQVLRNLLQNALKFSARSTPPIVEIGGQTDVSHCLFWIKDNGIGFAVEYRDTIFEIFRRLHTYDEFPGTGIGLALVKKSMELMAGEVWAEGIPGEGATFFLKLPANHPGQPAKPA